MGMKQRLTIAQAIMEDPKVLILDEPMNGLDDQGVEDFRKMLLQLKEEGKTILLASHDREDIEVLCDEVYEMNQGRRGRVCSVCEARRQGRETVGGVSVLAVFFVARNIY